MQSTSSYSLSDLLKSVTCSVMGGKVLTCSMGCISARICHVNCYLVTTIYPTISFICYLSSSTLYSSLSMELFPGLHQSQSPPDTIIEWALRMPISFMYPHISHILALSLFIELSCYVIRWWTPQPSLASPPPLPPQ